MCLAHKSRVAVGAPAKDVRWDGDLCLPRTGRQTRDSADYLAEQPSVGHRVVKVARARGEQRRLLGGLRNAVTAVAFSPDGKTVAAALEGRRLRRWDAAGGRPLGSLETPEEIAWLDYSPDCKRLRAGTSSGSVLLWDRDREPRRLSAPWERVEQVLLASAVGQGRILFAEAAEPAEQVGIAPQFLDNTLLRPGQIKRQTAEKFFEQFTATRMGLAASERGGRLRGYPNNPEAR